MLESVAKPVITAAFWGTWDKLNSVQSLDDIVKNGGHIIRFQLLPYNDSMNEWCYYYDLDSNQILLIQKLFDTKISSNGRENILNDD